MKKYPPWILLTWIISLLFGCSDSNYHKKSGKWHYDGIPVDRVNEPVNFKVIDRYFAKDEQTGFYQGSRIYGDDQASDGPTFEVVNTWYAKDKFRVYYCDTERDSKEYWSIKRTVVTVVVGADPATFRMMSDGYTPRDKAHVFNRVNIVPIRDIDSFKLLEHWFAKDKISAYYREKEIVGSDAASFTPIDQDYAKDKSKIYFVDGFYIGGTIKGVLIASFTALGDGYASDGKRAYYKGAVITSKDADSLVFLSRMGYAKTRSQVFHNGTLMPDADAASFAAAEKFDPNFDASDKRGAFSSGERIQDRK
jgi:hypothetical protein